MSYQIITDSCSDLPLELVDAYKLDVFNFTIRIGDEELIDDMGKSFDKQAFFYVLKMERQLQLLKSTCMPT